MGKDNQLGEHNIKPLRYRGQNGSQGSGQSTPIRSKLFCLNCQFQWKSQGLEEYDGTYKGYYATKDKSSICGNCHSTKIIQLRRATRVPKKNSNAMKRFLKYWESRIDSYNYKWGNRL